MPITRRVVGHLPMNANSRRRRVASSSGLYLTVHRHVGTTARSIVTTAGAATAVQTSVSAVLTVGMVLQVTTALEVNLNHTVKTQPAVIAG